MPRSPRRAAPTLALGPTVTTLTVTLLTLTLLLGRLRRRAAFGRGRLGP